MSDLTSGEEATSGATVAEAYQLTLTDSQSSGPAEVTGFAVAFYSDGQELTSDSESLNGPTFITPGQSLTWTEHPWGYSSGGASIGPFAAGQTGTVDPGATCELIQHSARHGGQFGAPVAHSTELTRMHRPMISSRSNPVA